MELDLLGGPKALNIDDIRLSVDLEVDDSGDRDREFQDDYGDDAIDAALGAAAASAMRPNGSVTFGTSPNSIGRPRPDGPIPSGGDLDSGLSPPLPQSQAHKYHPRGYRELDLEDDDGDPAALSRAKATPAQSTMATVASALTSLWGSNSAASGVVAHTSNPRGNSGPTVPPSVRLQTSGVTSSSATPPPAAAATANTASSNLALPPDATFTLRRPSVTSQSRNSASFQPESSSSPSSRPRSDFGSASPPKNASTAQRGPQPPSDTSAVAAGAGQEDLIPDEDAIVDLQQSAPAPAQTSPPQRLSPREFPEPASWNHRPSMSVVPMSVDDDDDAASAKDDAASSSSAEESAVGGDGGREVLHDDDGGGLAALPRLIANISIMSARNLCSADCVIQ
ncbi:hypothetical protein HK405_004062 [Cladochytrium tenue]|nr:hypothetical protein HK405_004062 [Cladochytrium tenue]